MIPISPYIVSKVFIVWMAIVCLVLTIVLCNTPDKYKTFYKFGPNENLIILGIKIDTYTKYMIIVSYSFINSIFRTIHHSFLSPWMIHNVRDEERDKVHLNHFSVYEISTVLVIYTWLDWLLYMNILLAQVDMVIIETLGELIISCITTYYYLQTPKPFVSKRMHAEIVPLLDS